MLASFRHTAHAIAMLMTSASAYAQAVPAETIPAVAQTNTQPDAEKVDLGEDRSDRMTVPVVLGGQGPFQFVVDTGSERTVLSRQLAERLALPSGTPAILHSVIGSAAVGTVRVPSLTIERQTLAVGDAPLLERRNLGADGMLGIDSLVSRQVLFDFTRSEMTIHPARERVLTADDGAIIVRARSKMGRLIFTRAVLDGQRVAVIIDTGSQFTIGNSRLLEKLGRGDLKLLPIDAQLISVTGQESQARIAHVGRLELGAVTLQEFGVAFAKADIFATLGLENEPALLLGMNAMRSFDKVLIDFANRKVSFVLPKMSAINPDELARLSTQKAPWRKR